MNVEQAMMAADEAEEAGLCGLYPMAAQVLAAEIRLHRDIANHCIPQYAYGDNEAACDMANRLQSIAS